jgi:hypothetical protein
MNRARIGGRLFACLAVVSLATIAAASSADIASQGSSATTAQKPAPPPRPDESLILNVPATAPWTDTGIVVRAGDRLQIRAWGQVKFGDEVGRGVTPSGLGKGGGCSFVVTNASVPAHALVANIAPQLNFDGMGFVVGPQWEGTVPVAQSTAPEGRLFLGFNDAGVLCDRTGYDSWAFRVRNSGAFTVEIAIWRRR